MSVAMNNTPLIEVQNLFQKIGTQEILRGITLSIYPGETLVLLGRSGGGKSVFLRHLIGLMKPVCGKILFEGKDITQLNERQLRPIRCKIGMLFQDGALFDSLSVFDNVAFPLREHGMQDEKEIREKVHKALALVNIIGHDGKAPVDLSGGMRKRVALARAIISPPSVILYDEPTAGLDPVVSDSINRLIRRLQGQLRVTSIVVTHDMVSAYRIGDRIALLDQGRIYFCGSPRQLRFSGDPIIRNFIEGRSLENSKTE